MGGHAAGEARKRHIISYSAHPSFLLALSKIHATLSVLARVAASVQVGRDVAVPQYPHKEV